MAHSEAGMKKCMLAELNKSHLFPIMGLTFSEDDFAEVALDKETTNRLGINGEKHLELYLEQCRNKTKATWLTGGYLEHRNLYKSPLFQEEDHLARDIHLGVDIWGKAGSRIYCPVNGTVHSFAYNKNHLDYGYTLILKHEIEEMIFHTLYGHLSAGFWDFWEIGKSINAGVQIAEIGEKHENGGWIPHLHFQVILDMEGNKGDYPGVCTSGDYAHYKNNCPDATHLIKKAPSS